MPSSPHNLSKVGPEESSPKGPQGGSSGNGARPRTRTLGSPDQRDEYAERRERQHLEGSPPTTEPINTADRADYGSVAHTQNNSLGDPTESWFQRLCARVGVDPEASMKVVIGTVIGLIVAILLLFLHSFGIQSQQSTVMPGQHEVSLISLLVFVCVN